MHLAGLNLSHSGQFRLTSAQSWSSVWCFVWNPASELTISMILHSSVILSLGLNPELIPAALENSAWCLDWSERKVDHPTFRWTVHIRYYCMSTKVCRSDQQHVLRVQELTENSVCSVVHQRHTGIRNRQSRQTRHPEFVRSFLSDRNTGMVILVYYTAVQVADSGSNPVIPPSAQWDLSPPAGKSTSSKKN